MKRAHILWGRFNSTGHLWQITGGSPAYCWRELAFYRTHCTAAWSDLAVTPEGTYPNGHPRYREEQSARLAEVQS